MADVWMTILADRMQALTEDPSLAWPYREGVRDLCGDDYGLGVRSALAYLNATYTPDERAEIAKLNPELMRVIGGQD